MDSPVLILLALFLRVSSIYGDQTEDPQNTKKSDCSTSFQTVYLEFMTSSGNTQEISTEVEVFDDSDSYSHILLKPRILKDQSSEIQVMDNSKDSYGVAQGIETVFRSVRLFGTFLQPYLQPNVPRVVTEAAENVKLVFFDSMTWVEASISECTSDLSVCIESILKPSRSLLKRIKGLYDCASDQEACFQGFQTFGNSELVQAFGNTVNAVNTWIYSPNAGLRTTAKYIARRGLMLPMIFTDIIFSISANGMFLFLIGIFGPKSLINICKKVAQVPITILLSHSLPLYIIYPMIWIGCTAVFEHLTPILQRFSTSMLRTELIDNLFVENVENYVKSYAQYYDKMEDECRQLKHPLGMKSDGVGDILEICCQVWNAIQRLCTGQSSSGADAGLVFRHMWNLF